MLLDGELHRQLINLDHSLLGLALDAAADEVEEAPGAQEVVHVAGLALPDLEQHLRVLHVQGAGPEVVLREPPAFTC